MNVTSVVIAVSIIVAIVIALIALRRARKAHAHQSNQTDCATSRSYTGGGVLYAKPAGSDEPFKQIGIVSKLEFEPSPDPELDRFCHLLQENQQIRAENAELHQQAERLANALAILQAAPPAPPLLTLRDITTIEQMAEKLRIAAPALHATQQFAASKEADRLANSAKRLADKLRPALIAAAAPVTPAQDAAA